MKSNRWFRFVILLVYPTLILNCSSSSKVKDYFSDRNPAQTGDGPFHTKRLDEIVDMSLAYVQEGYLTKENCSSVLIKNYADLNSLDAEFFDRSAWTPKNLLHIQKNLWNLQLALRQKMRDWIPYQNTYSYDPLTDICVAALRDSFRAIRFIGDYVGYLAAGKPTENMKPNQRTKPYVLYNEKPETQINPLVAKAELSEGFELHSGDVFASRGNAVTSAAIARLGTVDSQFSHLAIVYVDPVTHEPWTIESHIEAGVLVAPFKKYATSSNLRVVQYRFRDGKLAHEAARLIIEKARSVIASTKKPIPYDFKANLNDDSTMYCSEVVRRAYELALAKATAESHGVAAQLPVPPLFLTQVHMKNRDFLDKLQIPEGNFFAPGDMELDPRFEVISEWRDFSRVKEVWAYDASLTAVFNWMENYQYKLRPPGILWAAGKVEDYMPWVGEKLAKTFTGNGLPSTMNGEIVKVSQTISLAGSIVIKKLLAEVDKRDVLPTPREMAEMLEKIRQDDAEAYRQWGLVKFYKWATKGQKVFHRYLRPDNMASVWVEPSPKKDFVLETTRIPASEGLVDPTIHKKRVEKVHLGDD